MYASPLSSLADHAATHWRALLQRFRPGKPRAFRQPVEFVPPVSIHLASGPVKPRNRLLLFIALDGAPRGLDPIRLQKGMFLFAMSDESEAGEVYRFVPYNYGPMSTQIYRDLETLLENDLIEAEPVEGQSWARYSATERGLISARELLKSEPSQTAAQRLFEIKNEVSSHTYQEVLEDVYERYPEFASKSVFRRAS